MAAAISYVCNTSLGEVNRFLAPLLLLQTSVLYQICLLHVYLVLNVFLLHEACEAPYHDTTRNSWSTMRFSSMPEEHQKGQNTGSVGPLAWQSMCRLRYVDLIGSMSHWRRTQNKPRAEPLATVMFPFRLRPFSWGSIVCYLLFPRVLAYHTSYFWKKIRLGFRIVPRLQRIRTGNLL